MKSDIDADIFGTTFDCECGRRHTIDPRVVVYARGAAERLPALCAEATQGRRAAVLMDKRTRAVAGEAVCRKLAEAGWAVREIPVSDRADGGSPVCDDVTKEAVSAKIETVDLIVPVGSGVISDLGKWNAFERDLPFVSFATAASMNGYASANVAPTIDGVKTLVRASPPVAVVADPDIIGNAPWEMTASGLGDILAKSVSSADWLLNHVLFGDFFCARSVALIADIEPLYMDHPEDLKARSPRAVEALFRGLLLTGVAMTMAGTSSPSSGGEHMIGHTLDMMSSVDGAPHDLHGRQVGVGTVLASELYRRVLEVESPDFAEPRVAVDKPFWGKLADVVEKHYAGKVERLRLTVERLSQANAWDDLRSRLADSLRSPEVVHDCLSRADAACRAEDIGCDRGRLLAAFLHAHEIRSRFTVVDLARILGIMPDAAEEIVETWAV